MTPPFDDKISPKHSLAAGDRAPDFTATTATGETVRLSERLARGAVVLFFYPKDDSVVCTAEACAFRDSYEAFTAAGAEVIGISRGDGETHRRFAEKNRLPFLLLSDEDGAIRRLYGVRNVLGVIPGRVTFVIGKDGVVRQVFESLLEGQKHVTEALKTLQNSPLE
ncbi:peroxiredoxin [Capsulimonas corticalis]|uniref:thioredoxin-dependent peroxiredoxin n=1 Tax=Capsulimonas corticalis TaxID=2219043 RepID=A0A402CUD8_9BACT|nr:peroxiredoxin [Capsulimonas corticalis]BDI28963.1 peroxiredoxin [Capsulimonas corticalis]